MAAPIRVVHLYLGCVFAPMILFFAMTGACQTFRLHKSSKDGSYHAPAILVKLSEVHEDQMLPGPDHKPSIPLRILVVLMALGLVTTTLLGIVMAFKTSQKKGVILLCLVGGSLIPVLLLLI